MVFKAKPKPQETEPTTATVAAAGAAVAALDRPSTADIVQAAKERDLRQLNPARMKGAEYEREIHVVTADEGTIPEDMLNPAYWAHVAGKLKPWSRIEARANDGTWYAECLVLDASRNWARVKILGQWNLTTTDVSQAQRPNPLIAYETRHRGPHNKWSVIRLADSACIHEFEDTEEGAKHWLANHLKAMK